MKKLFLLIHWCLAQDSLYSLKDHLIFAANVLQRKWWVKVHTPKYPEWITNRLAWKSALFWVGEKKWQGTLSPMNSFKGGMRLAAHRVTEYEAGKRKEGSNTFAKKSRRTFRRSSTEISLTNDEASSCTPKHLLTTSRSSWYSTWISALTKRGGRVSWPLHRLSRQRMGARLIPTPTSSIC